MRNIEYIKGDLNYWKDLVNNGEKRLEMNKIKVCELEKELKEAKNMKDISYIAHIGIKKNEYEGGVNLALGCDDSKGQSHSIHCPPEKFIREWDGTIYGVFSGKFPSICLTSNEVKELICVLQKSLNC